MVSILWARSHSFAVPLFVGFIALVSERDLKDSQALKVVKAAYIIAIALSINERSGTESHLQPKGVQSYHKLSSTASCPVLCFSKVTALIMNRPWICYQVFIKKNAFTFPQEEKDVLKCPTHTLFCLLKPYARRDLWIFFPLSARLLVLHQALNKRRPMMGELWNRNRLSTVEIFPHFLLGLRTTQIQEGSIPTFCDNEKDPRLVRKDHFQGTMRKRAAPKKVLE